MAKKLLKIGVQRGAGPPLGYRWTVLIPDIAFDEPMDFLGEDQYSHMAEQVRELAREDDPTHSEAASVDAIENFHELRDWGGILGGLNVRVYFYVDKNRSAMVILGAIKKKNKGPTPTPDKIRMRRRLRKYLNGEFDEA